MDGELVGLLGLALGSAGLAGVLSLLLQVSYPRRLEASIRRLADAREHVTDDPRASLVVEQAIRQDTMLLALSRLHGVTAWGVFARIVLGVVFAGVIAGIAVAYSQWRPTIPSAEYPPLDTLMWLVGVLLFSYPSLGMTALHFERRARERRLAATALMLDGTSIETPEIRNARRRWARSRRIQAGFRRARQRRWYGDPTEHDLQIKRRNRVRWARARAIAERRAQRRHHGATFRDLARTFDQITIWPYVVRQRPGKQSKKTKMK